MKIIIQTFLFFMISFSVFSDQKDKRLDNLFEILRESKNNLEIDAIANQIWKIWLETNDPFIDEDFSKGLELMNRGYLKESIELFTKVINSNSNFAEAWNKRATVYYLLGDFDLSVKDIRETLKLEPRHFGAMDGLSLIFIHTKEYEEAIKVYEKMLKIFPHNSNTLIKKDTLKQLLSEKI